MKVTVELTGEQLSLINGVISTYTNTKEVFGVMKAEELNRLRELTEVMYEATSRLIEVEEAAKPKSKWPTPTTDEPDIGTMEMWLADGVAEATDGCSVEPDGVCQHGHPSWIMGKFF
jgi:hypothetical protein